jgi:hypothetical protein
VGGREEQLHSFLISEQNVDLPMIVRYILTLLTIKTLAVSLRTTRFKNKKFYMVLGLR